eukprot:2131345-Pleurochrysis_carterae.AAC.1
MQLAKMSGHRGTEGFQQFGEQNGTSRLEYELRGPCTPQSIGIIRSSFPNKGGEVLESHCSGTLRHPCGFEPLKQRDLLQADNTALGARVVKRWAQSSCCEAQLFTPRVAKPGRGGSARHSHGRALTVRDATIAIHQISHDARELRH